MKRIIFIHRSNLFLCLFIISCLCCISACSIDFGSSQEEKRKNVILNDLENRYGEEFEIESIYRDGDGYKAMCYPANDKELKFSCLYGKDGSLGYDFYVGALLAREETDCFRSSIGDKLGEIYVKGTYVLAISEGVPNRTNSNLSICDLIKKGDYSIRDIYDIYPINSIGFRVFIDKSSEVYSDDAESEYDVFAEAVNELVTKYRDDYGLNIFVSLEIYFLNEEDYKVVVEYFKTGKYEDSYKSVINCTKCLIMEMGTPTESVTEKLWLTKTDYVAKKEAFNE